MDELEKQYQLGVLAKAQGVPLQDYFDLETMLDLWGEAMADRKQARELASQLRDNLVKCAEMSFDKEFSQQVAEEWEFSWERDDGKY